jgi:hypothetical protein
VRKFWQLLPDPAIIVTWISCIHIDNGVGKFFFFFDRDSKKVLQIGSFYTTDRIENESIILRRTSTRHLTNYIETPYVVIKTVAIKEEFKDKGTKEFSRKSSVCSTNTVR